MKKDQNLFFEDLARSFDVWVKTATEALCSSNTNLIWSNYPDAYKKLQKVIEYNNLKEEISKILPELFNGIITSVLVTFDGGSSLAETATLKIKSSNGEVFDTYLHELFTDYLLDTNRFSIDIDPQT